MPIHICGRHVENFQIELETFALENNKVNSKYNVVSSLPYKLIKCFQTTINLFNIFVSQQCEVSYE